LIGVEYDIYHSMMYFLLYLDCEKWYEMLKLYGDIVGECMYVNWWWYCWWMHIC